MVGRGRRRYEKTEVVVDRVVSQLAGLQITTTPPSASYSRPQVKSRVLQQKVASLFVSSASLDEKFAIGL